MIKVRVHYLTGYWEVRGNISYTVGDWLYCVYFLGFLIHSVRINGLTQQKAKELFGNNKIVLPKKKDDK